MRIGILYAMPREADGLLEQYGDLEPEYFAGVPFYQVHKNTVICVGGVGKVNAAMSTQLLIDRFHVERVVNVGCAGALEDLETGTLVLATDCVQHDVDTTLAGDPEGWVSTVDCDYFPCADVERTLTELRALGESFVPGVVATGDWFGRDFERAERICDTFGAMVCEMEACAAAQVCMRNRIPFLAMKTVSDHLFAAQQEMEYEEDFDGAMKALNGAVYRYIEWLEEQ